MLGRVSHLLLAALAAVSVIATSPSADDELRAFFAREGAAVKPLNLGRRSAASSQTRHLRPNYDEPVAKRSKRDIAPPDVGQVADFGGQDPQPIRNGNGDTYLANSNHEIDAQNPDNVAAPPTDAGTVPNLKWSMSLSHTRLLKGGWVREQTITDLPPSKDIAAAELRLSPNAYRELHWHRVAEWGYILNGTGRISAIDDSGRSYISDIKGPLNGTDPDIYYFPPGVPHSIQALDEGLEILLIFTDGNFDASGTTFMLSDWLAHTPLEVVAQNLGVNTSVLSGIPQKDPYILESTVPPPQFGHSGDQAVSDPNGNVPSPYVFHLDQQEKKVAPGGGGWVKIQDSATNFPISTLLASALVFVEPNGLRELHWHTNDEWFYVISGHGRATAFPGGSSARTFDFQPGDTAVFPVSYGHYVKNLSPTEPLIFLELFKASKFVDFSATQWLALTPRQVVADLLKVPVSVVEGFAKEKQIIVS
ncbi:Bicupin oxalate decarboxylase/oxidase [Trametes versicolor FP-101664 SS1]|uniref:Bicupin oxalate decarboxylase/oxidase n=1 Tax=Trametes versicolor (strain FP-101664) TaxID=717944 RepID=UPI000462392E|nr:Bicupin oxalate decarboxylase/oxidase [Trametes versicolor FP-101664 SS1]EIW56396.1 Bicupin oxalate decarboxylase/oxidase [Trametes versicolor FP-101664 SS1]